MSEVNVLSIETLHLKTTIDKNSYEKAVRFARTLMDAKGTKTRQILTDGKWTEVNEELFPSRVESLRSQYIEKLKAELLEEVKNKVKPQPQPKAKSKPQPKPTSATESIQRVQS